MVGSITPRIKKIPYYIYVILAIHLAGRISEHFNQPFPYPLNAYLDDFLFLPFTLWFAETVGSWIQKKTITIKFGFMVVITLYISFMFEWLLPKYNPYFVSDPWDVLVYFCGGVFYLKVLKRFNLD